MFQTIATNISKVPQSILAIMKNAKDEIQKKYADARDEEILIKVLKMLWFGNGFASIMKDCKGKPLYFGEIR